MTKTSKVLFKAGDDFVLTITVTNKYTTTAIDAATAVDVAQALYDAQLDLPIPNPATLASLLVTLNAAIVTYDTAIIVNITGWTITSSMKWLGKHVADFTVSFVDASVGIFIISLPSTQTQPWKPRVYDADIQFVILGRKSSSQTFQVDVKKDITMEV